MQPRLRTIEQVANELGLAEVTIRSWVAQRRLEHVKLGRSVRIPISEVERIIEEGTVPARRRR
jgi:excisionase family DNA binding protein